MTRRGGAPRCWALALALLVVACGDESTAPDAEVDETIVVSLVGIGADGAGILLQLTGGVDRIEPTHASLEVAWEQDQSNGAIVAIVGPLAERSDLLLVRRRMGLEPLGAEVLELADTAGEVSAPAFTRAIVRSGHD